VQGIADDMEGKLSVVKIDTDKYPNIASRYGIKVRNALQTCKQLTDAYCKRAKAGIMLSGRKSVHP
jgi:hypothetical protein